MLTLAIFGMTLQALLQPYLLTLANRNDPISVTMPKVAKASTIVAVTCRCRCCYCLKYNSNVHEPLRRDRNVFIVQATMAFLSGE